MSDQFGPSQWSAGVRGAGGARAGVYMMGGLAPSSAQNLVDGMDDLAASWVWK